MENFYNYNQIFPNIFKERFPFSNIFQYITDIKSDLVTLNITLFLLIIQVKSRLQLAPYLEFMKETTKHKI